ncbi:transcriptional regulator, TetR family [Lachnospiraceae bacterium XBB1006]|nr:transcriptional regulator, TetR family [Lachnospiraceae bacterium XBB1006]
MTSKKERTREMILEAAYPLFAKEGFNKITMKDICDATGLSRGGLYSHFPGTKELFEAILVRIQEKEEMNFQKEMAAGMSATEILEKALSLMEEEMKQPDESLSLAIYEYAGSVSQPVMNDFTQIGFDKWSSLIQYGIKRKEFHSVDVFELTNVILYVYQGVRMWSRITDMTPAVFSSIINHIRKELLRNEE